MCDEARVDGEHTLAGDEGVERKPVGDVVGALDGEVPEALVDDVARSEVVLGGEHRGARLELGAHGLAGALGAAPRRVGAHAGAQLEDGAGDLEPSWDLAAGPELEQEVETAVAAPVAHAGRAALADVHEACLLQALERLAHRVAARAELVAE